MITNVLLWVPSVYFQFHGIHSAYMGGKVVRYIERGPYPIFQQVSYESK